jgi:hypothetical protein
MLSGFINNHVFIQNHPHELFVCKMPSNARPLTKPMKRCTCCRSVPYCSRDCQKLAWKTHKPACRTVQPGETPPVHNNRTTMSMNYMDFQRLSGGSHLLWTSAMAIVVAKAETIYYLETSTPHMYDISVSGPYYPLDAIIPQVLRNFGRSVSSRSVSVPTRMYSHYYSTS